MSLLSIIQQHCKKHALAVPTAIIGSSDTQVIQLYALLQEFFEEMVTESKYNVTTQECTFTAQAQADQGALQTLCPNGYQFPIFETFFDRTLRLPLIGPVAETEWQELEALPSAGVRFKFRIKQDHLFFYPTPTSPFSTIAFEYASSWYTKNASGVLKAFPDTDSDVFLFPDNIIRRGLAYRWKQEKGLPYQADETQYWHLLNNFIAKDKVKRRINISEPIDQDMKPGIMVPTNTWPV